ncbi:MAG: hypothetical protein A2X36_01080 [Elusimicrobia bacterium GWA2_69_24]|nr:MAG: hypothetical protein A2X36_01080 [Elusimicrobia bacterium GWA2_69_24]HBL16460.1 hypothetical protein [Elusimicrobiota bacterium]
MRIVHKVILFTSSIILIVVGMGGYLAIRWQERFLAGVLREQAAQHAETIKKSLRHHMLANKRADVQWIIETVGRQEGIREIHVFDKKGTIAFSSDRGNIGRRIDTASPRCAQCHEAGAKPSLIAQGGGAARLLTDAAGKRIISAMAPIYNEPACHQCHAPARVILGELEVELPYDPTEHLIRTSQRTVLALTAALILLLSLSLGAFTQREVGRPIRRLIEATHLISAGDLSPRIAHPLEGEIGSLAQSFNRMAGELEKSKAKLDNWTQELADEVKRATADLQEANLKLSAASQVKSKFVRDVSHELRAPLASIESCLQVVSEGYAASVEEQAEMVERARRKTRFLLRLVNDLLDLGHIEGGIAVDRDQHVRIDALILKSVDGFRERAKQRGVALETELAPQLPVLRANPVELERLFTNLLDNAIKYNRPDGKVRISAVVKAGQVEVSVSDTGIGMSAEDLGSIFQEFFRSAAARKHEKEGTGLGLSFVKRLVDACGGRVEVESQAGKGSTFRIRLPSATV